MDENVLKELHRKLVAKVKNIAPEPKDMGKLIKAIPELIDSLSSAEKIQQNYFEDNSSPEQF